jgi:hypothetical protein
MATSKILINRKKFLADKIKPALATISIKQRARVAQ